MDQTLPQIKILEEKESTSGKYVVEPLDRGYGSTLGNALRRVMLSSIEGAAITYVKIDKVLHEFSTIPGVKEDTTELLLNLKNLYVKVELSPEVKFEHKTLSIHKKGEGRVTGADVQCPEDVTVVNPEVYLATISDENSSLDMEMTVEMGKGYVLPDKQEHRVTQPIGVIPLGASFTPVRKVNYTVESTRVGFKTDYERLILEVVTNGTITPQLAVNRSAEILLDYFQLFMDFVGKKDNDDATKAIKDDNGSIIKPPVPDARIEELDFSVRTYNCLKKANILTIGELTQHTENDLMQIRNFGKKSLLEVRERLGKLEVELKGGNVIAINPEEMEDGGSSGSENDEEEIVPTDVSEVEAETVSEPITQSEEEANTDKPEGSDEPTPEPRKARRGRALTSETITPPEQEENPNKPEGSDEPTPELRKSKRGRASSGSVSNDKE